MAYWLYKTAKHYDVKDPVGFLCRFLVILVFALLWLIVKAIQGRFLFNQILAKGKPALVFLVLLLSATFLGFMRMSVELVPHPIEGYLSGGKKAEISALGTIKTAGIKNGTCTLVLNKVLLTLGGREYRLPAVMTVSDEALWEKLSKRETGETGMLPGMRIEVTGKAELFKRARNPGEFDYAFYYRAQKLRCKIKVRDIVVKDGRIAPIHRLVLSVTSFVSKALTSLCSEEDRGIYEAVLLGEKRDLSEDIRELYQKNGIAHLLAVSGLHVSLIGMSFYAFLRYTGLNYGKAGFCAGLLVIFYGFLTGFGPSVFRAVFMILCFFLAGCLGRTYDLLSAMALSLLFLAFDSPYLLFTSGLQLSFGAVAAIGIASERDKEWKLFISVFIQLFTYPIILYHFFEFPIYALFLNLIVIPLMAYVVGSGLAGVFLYGLSCVLLSAGVSAFPAVYLAAKGAVGTGHYILAFYSILCRAAEQLPFYSVTAGRPEGWKIIVYYGILFLALHWKGKTEKRWRTGFLTVGSLLVIFLMFRPVFGLNVYFLDVGQGDGIFLETSKCRILVDGGSSQLKNLGKQRLLPFLKSKGVPCLDYVFVSHGDLDHISGIRYLLEEDAIKIKNMIFSCRSAEDESCKELEALAKQRGSAVWYMESGQEIERGKLSLVSIYPSKDFEGKNTEEDKNNQSLVLLARYGSFSLLLTGDVEMQGEAEILQFGGEKLPKHLTVLKAAHHGSKSSTGEAIIEQLSPAVTVLSYGAGNTYGHPSGEVVERLKDAGTSIWRTEEAGTVIIKTNGKQYTVEGFIER